MVFYDNRDFISAIDRTGDLVRIKQEVDWDGEAGAIIKLSDEKQSPAPLMERVKDYPAGYRIFGSPLGTYRRIAISLGMAPETHIRAIQEEYERRLTAPIKPVLVSSGPCKEVIMKGQDVDMCRLPATMNMEGEDARYMGTWDLIIVKDPDSEWTNWGMYRAEVHNRKTLGITLNIAHHGGKIFLNKFRANNKPMPVAVVVGADPLCHMASVAEMEVLESEVDYAGGLRRQPVEMVKCETIDLLVPASSETVVEGIVLPDYVVSRNPFAEYAGYMAPPADVAACQVTAITHRRDPIFTVANPGYPYYGGSACSCLGASVGHKRHLREHGIPVTDVYIPVEGADLLMIVAVKNPRAFTPSAIAQAAFSGTFHQQKVLVMEDDVDIFNLNDVFFHLATRCNPVRGIKIFTNIYGSRLIPNLSRAEKKQFNGSGVLLDCTWPVDWDRDTEVPVIASFEKRYPEKLKEKVIRNWKSYGFKY